MVLAVLPLLAALPWIAARTLEEVLSGALAARFEIGDVALALYKGEVVFEDLTLRAMDTSAERAGGRRIALDLDWGALLSGSLEAERLAAWFAGLGRPVELSHRELGPNPAPAHNNRDSQADLR